MPFAPGAAPVALTDPIERGVVGGAACLLDGGDLGDVEYSGLVELIGEDGVIELMVLVGYYESLARILRVLRVPT